MKTFTIASKPYYDQFNQCYKNILTVNCVPDGPLKHNVRKIAFPKLSPFQVDGPCTFTQKCGLCIVNTGISCGTYTRGCNLMTPNEIPDLISFLQLSGYQIETQLTNMMNQTQITNPITFTASYFGANQPNIMYIK